MSLATLVGTTFPQSNTLIQPSIEHKTRVSLMCLQEGEGSEPEINPLALLPVLADFVRLKDPGMLILEVSGLAAKYPDIR